MDGRLIAPGTWEYKPAMALDIPVKFNVTLVDSVNTAKCAVLGSKASGEPAMLLGAAPFFAVKDAIYAARAEARNPQMWLVGHPESHIALHV